MFSKGSKIYSMTTGCCPKCQEESMYKYPSFLAIWNILNMNESCSHCKLKYQIEPSFFFGAMFVSYGLSVGVAIMAFLFSFFAIHVTLKQSFIYIIFALIITMPFVLRLSRNIWINIFVDFDKNWKDKMVK